MAQLIVDEHTPESPTVTVMCVQHSRSREVTPSHTQSMVCLESGPGMDAGGTRRNRHRGDNPSPEEARMERVGARGRMGGARGGGGGGAAA